MPEISQEQLDQITEDLQIANLQLQEARDTLEGNITSRNMASFRNTYVINAQDSLDASYPMYIHFNILDETVRIVSVKVSYWILNYRAYSTAATEKEAVTSGASSVESSASGGGETPTSSSVSTPSGGGSTSGAGIGNESYALIGATYTVTNVGDENKTGFLPYQISYGIASTVGHTHSTPNHTHPVHAHTVAIAAHTHNIPHTHTIPAHTHDITYGIHEEENTPTIAFSVSEDGGVGYSDEFGKVAIDQSLIDITDKITTTGSKLIKFTSTTRTRLSVQIEVKLDIKVR